MSLFLVETFLGSWPAVYLHIDVEVAPRFDCWPLLSSSLYRSHVLTTFLGPVLGAMMKQVCWHSRCSKAFLLAS